VKRFRVKLVQTILVEIDDDRATEKSAAYLAENIGVCHFKEGRSKNFSGAFKLAAEPGAKAEKITEVDSTVKSS
jgi:hypothetical protein